MRLHYFDYFRAVSILLILTGHCYSGWAIDTVPEKLIANLITGATSLFVFISGFFFHHIFYSKFSYSSFLIKKSTNVFLPYVILATIAFLYIVLFLNKTTYWNFDSVSSVPDYIIIYMKYMVSGRVLNAYWYIPFIMIIFLLSPLFIKYINLPTNKQVIIFLLLLILSMIVHRPTKNINPLHSVIYFTPIYLLGIIVSINAKKVTDLIKNRALLLLSLAVTISLVQVLFYGTHENFHKDEIFSFESIDIIIIQKIFLIFFFLSILYKVNEINIQILKFLASISFSIFFLHPWVIFFNNYYSLTDYWRFLPGFFIFALNANFTLIVSILLTLSIKKILHNKSKYLIGY